MRKVVEQKAGGFILNRASQNSAVRAALLPVCIAPVSRNRCLTVDEATELRQTCLDRWQQR